MIPCPDENLDFVASWVPRSLKELSDFMVREPYEVVAGVYAVAPLDQELFEKAAKATIGADVFSGISEFVWRLMAGEGYTHEAWVGLFKGLPVYGVCDVWFRWMGLVESGLRRRNEGAEPMQLDPRHVLKWAGKALHGV